MDEIVSVKDESSTERLSVKDESSTERATNYIQANLKNVKSSVTTSVERRIYKVPAYLSTCNKEHYTPRVISIGPFHNDKRRFQVMEQRKLRYVNYFLQRTGCQNRFKDLVSLIKRLEESVRLCYADQIIDLSSDEFVNIILVDAIFILELFCRHYLKTSDESDAILEPWLASAIRSDLILLENQLPFSVLETVFNLTLASHPEYSSYSLRVMTFDYFQFYNTQAKDPHDRNLNIKHLLDLLRTFWLPPMLPLPPPPVLPLPAVEPERFNDVVNHLYSATRYNILGLRFKAGRFKAGSSKCLFDMNSTPGVLEIAPLTLDNSSETLFRNLLALELCHYPNEGYITDYFIILSFLIKDAKDVNLFVQESILVNSLRNSDAAAKLVNNLVADIKNDDKNFCYYDFCRRLKAFGENYYNFWQIWMYTLKRDYFSTPWKGAATVAAIVLLVLTFIQTVCTMIPLL